MSDVVTCPGCAGEVDRDEHLLCPGCHMDVTGVLAGVVRAPQVASWTCSSPGCEHNAPLRASVAACPFCLEARKGAAAEAFELRDESGAIVVALTGPGPWRLGRAEADSTQLSTCMTVSRSHALLARRSSGLSVRDLGSSNRTFVGPVALAPGEERILEPGSTIGLGRTVVLHVHTA
jgi:hypothetical protein